MHATVTLHIDQCYFLDIFTQLLHSMYRILHSAATILKWSPTSVEYIAISFKTVSPEINFPVYAVSGMLYSHCLS